MVAVLRRGSHRSQGRRCDLHWAQCASHRRRCKSQRRQCKSQGRKCASQRARCNLHWLLCGLHSYQCDVHLYECDMQPLYGERSRLATGASPSRRRRSWRTEATSPLRRRPAVSVACGACRRASGIVSTVPCRGGKGWRLWKRRETTSSNASRNLDLWRSLRGSVETTQPVYDNGSKSPNGGSSPRRQGRCDLRSPPASRPSRWQEGAETQVGTLWLKRSHSGLAAAFRWMY